MIKGSCHCQSVRWTYKTELESATACNCTVCRRYGSLWAYDHLNEGIEVSGETNYYARDEKHIEFHFCKACGCVAYWLAAKEHVQGKKRMAVNLRLADDPEQIKDLPIDHFDGLDEFKDLPSDGRCIKDLWF
ncbi:MAG: GFA family protein [Bdellovibrionales bacterium]|nr:GFA family protein [Bdellovibrionales bacterium]